MVTWDVVDTLMVMSTVNFVPENLQGEYDGMCDTGLTHARHRLQALGMVIRSDRSAAEYVAVRTNFTEAKWNGLRDFMIHTTHVGALELLVVAVGPSLQPGSALTIWDGNHRCATLLRRWFCSCAGSCCSSR